MDSTTITKNCTFISFNCKGFSGAVGCVRDLCKSADIIALQETWLLQHDIPLLGTIDSDFAYTGKTAVDLSSGVLRGRPYGGVAILWRKSLFPCVSVIQCQSDRLTGIKVSMCDSSMIIITMYMPTDERNNLVEFVAILGEI
jgi:exonuclease III